MNYVNAATDTRTTLSPRCLIFKISRRIKRNWNRDSALNRWILIERRSERKRSIILRVLKFYRYARAVSVRGAKRLSQSILFSWLKALLASRSCRAFFLFFFSSFFSFFYQQRVDVSGVIIDRSAISREYVVYVDEQWWVREATRRRRSTQFVEIDDERSNKNCNCCFFSN